MKRNPIQLTGFCFAVATMIGWCEVPSTLNYQGRLLNANGQPATGTVSVALSLYTNSTGGTSVYTEDIGLVPVQDGVYSFNWGASGVSTWDVPFYIFATADGINSVFRHTVQHVPMVLGSVTITDGVHSWSDRTGTSTHPAEFLGIVTDYTNGTVSAVYLAGPPTAGTHVSVAYSYETRGLWSAMRYADAMWLEVVIEGVPLEPRHRLVAVPFAVKAKQAEVEGARLDELESGLAAWTTEITDFANTVGTLPMGFPNVISESFEDPKGYSRLVSRASPESHVGVYAASTVTSNDTEVTTQSTHPNFAKVKSVPLPNCIVGSAVNRIKISSSGINIFCYLRFIYADGSEADSNSSISSIGIYVTQNSNNPYPEKSVIRVDVYLSMDSTTRTAYERGTRFLHTGLAYVELSLPVSSYRGAAHTMLTVRGEREGDDEIYYDVSDGTRTDVHLPLNTKNPVLNLTGPATTLRVWLKPASENPTYHGGTTLRALAFRYWDKSGSDR